MIVIQLQGYLTVSNVICVLIVTVRMLEGKKMPIKITELTSLGQVTNFFDAEYF